jgi:hypothetical protein
LPECGKADQRKLPKLRQVALFFSGKLSEKAAQAMDSCHNPNAIGKHSTKQCITNLGRLFLPLFLADQRKLPKLRQVALFFSGKLSEKAAQAMDSCHNPNAIGKHSTKQCITNLGRLFLPLFLEVSFAIVIRFVTAAITKVGVAAFRFEGRSAKSTYFD